MNNEKKIENIKSSRIKSIDIFRGVTIFLMIFVNDLPSVTNISFWLKHMPADQSGMTIPDIVFPAFLFIVGMSIPLALKKRIENNESNFQIIFHILKRSFALLVLGVLMVNIGRLNEELTGISSSLWSLLMFVSVILVWNVYPKYKKKNKVFTYLKLIGIIILLLLVAIFRSGTIGNQSWLSTSWWGILGLIGWAYLVSSIIYLFSKKNLTFLITIFGVFLAVYIGDKEGVFDFLVFNKSFLLLGPHLAGHSAITTAGIILTLIFQKNGFLNDYQNKIRKSIVFALVLAFVGLCLEPLYGISKIYTTPAFVLYSSSICVLLFCLLYWIVDIKKIDKIFKVFNPAGSNPLLAYILPSIIYSLVTLFGIHSYLNFWRDGSLGIIRTTIFSLLVLWITNELTKLKIQLKL